MQELHTDMATKCSNMMKVLFSSPIGDMEIVGCQIGLHSVKQTDPDDSTFTPNEKQKASLKGNPPIKDCKPVQECVVWLENYFNHKTADTRIPSLCPCSVQKGSFKEKAWTALPKAVPFGSTISYKELAELCGNNKACRAAGQAMATNPVSLLIPCHRVISSQGAPGNYSHGKKNSIKVWLLDFESNVATT